MEKERNGGGGEKKMGNDHTNRKKQQVLQVSFLSTLSIGGQRFAGSNRYPRILGLF